MVDPFGMIGTAVDVSPLLKRRIDALVGKSSVAKLRDLVAGDLGSAHEINAMSRKAVARTWSSEGVDPTSTAP